MEAIGIPTGRTKERARPRGLTRLREGIRSRRLERARRAHALRASRPRAPYVPGSEHTHLLRQRGF